MDEREGCASGFVALREGGHSVVEEEKVLKDGRQNPVNFWEEPHTHTLSWILKEVDKQKWLC